MVTAIDRGERGFRRVGADCPAIQKGSDELRARALAGPRPRGPWPGRRSSRKVRRKASAIECGLLRRDDLGGELAHLRVRVGEQGQDLVAPRSGTSRGAVRARRWPRRCIRLESLRQWRSSGPMCDSSGNLERSWIARKRMSSSSSLERLQREVGGARRGRRLHDGEGLLADRRSPGAGEDLRQPGQDPLVRVFPEVVEGGVHHGGVLVREKPLQLLEERPARQELEGAHGLAADGFGPRAEVREERSRGRLVGNPLQEADAGLAEGRIRLDGHPGDVLGFDVRRGAQRAQQLVPLRLVSPAPSVESVQKGIELGCLSLGGPHGGCRASVGGREAGRKLSAFSDLLSARRRGLAGR